ncbi:MAG: DUF429 domain-containing protein [Thermoanaerobaculia bacterium]
MGVRVTQLDPREDHRGSSFHVPLPFDSARECHVATVRPGFVRGNHFHRRGREILVVLHADAWTLLFDDGEGTDIRIQRFDGAGAVQIEIDPPCAHAIRNDGRRDLQLFVIGEASRDADDHDTYPRVLAAAARRIAGIDGCRAGWVAVIEDAEGLHALVAATDAELYDVIDSAAITAIDIPIGLAESGARACDHHARRFLGGGHSSVFPAPLRALVAIHDHAEAARRSREVQGKGVSRQAVAIYPKVQQIDRILQMHRELRDRVCEVHPEVSFVAWNNGAALGASKHTPEGVELRRALVATHFGSEAVESVIECVRGRARIDDVLDAFAALWTAERIADGRARELGDGHCDATGLPMRIVY